MDELFLSSDTLRSGQPKLTLNKICQNLEFKEINNAENLQKIQKFCLKYVGHARYSADLISPSRTHVLQKTAKDLKPRIVDYLNTQTKLRKSCTIVIKNTVTASLSAALSIVTNIKYYDPKTEQDKINKAALVGTVAGLAVFSSVVDSFITHWNNRDQATATQTKERRETLAEVLSLLYTLESSADGSGLDVARIMANKAGDLREEKREVLGITPKKSRYLYVGGRLL